VKPVVEGMMRHPTHAWGLVEGVEPGRMRLESKQRGVALWYSYGSSTYCDREPRSSGDDCIRR
jgi:hypothetical protein